MTDPVDIVARALDDVATAAAANAGAPSAAALRSIAGEVLDELLAEPLEPPPAVERDEDAVRLVDEVLRDSLALPRIEAAAAVVAALFDRPTVTLHHETGRIGVDWQDTPSHRPRACIFARDLLDDIVERLNGTAGEPSDPDENHATVALTITPHRDDLLDALGDAVARAHEARALVEAAPPLPGPVSPDCKAGKCTACNGDAWSVTLDAHTDCEHPCHAS